eukprot:NODE_3164_length_1034_cov_30.210152_g2908_i0.p1 GENE.NODE_3164_length_1034_cov_30.210152_g2908_i0~~NODE_3164_length_1034_cov_30.210152_g2908_i0.p1  ORF type:complete len:254 (+),score=70.46 NODE_3164_length_1034_cov_30.210152_g2908_i0:117-764(+)
MSPAVLPAVLDGATVEKVTEKPVAHEYILLPDKRLNLKIAGGGSAFDIKWLESESDGGVLQKLVGIAKGPLSCTAGCSLAERAQALEAKLVELARDAPPEIAPMLTLCAEQYSAAKLLSGELWRVETTKTNLTLRASGDLVVERIELKAEYFKGKSIIGGFSLRSASVEGRVDEAVVKSLAEQARSKQQVTGHPTAVFGAFNTMLAEFAKSFGEQ